MLPLFIPCIELLLKRLWRALTDLASVPMLLLLHLYRHELVSGDAAQYDWKTAREFVTNQQYAS